MRHLVLSSLRLFVILVPALATVFLVARAIFDQNLSDIRYAIGLSVVFVLTLLIKPPVSGAFSKMSVIKFLAITIPVILLVPITVVALIFGKVDMASFVFHLVFTMDDTPWGDLSGYIFTSLIYWIVFCLCIYRARHWLNLLWPSWAVISVGLLAINPLANDLMFNRVASVYAKEKSLAHEFVHIEPVPLLEKKNLIILYLEGYERTYFDQAVFGDATIPLAKLESQAISFTDIKQASGTGWSLAGTIATQCGAPTLPLGAKPLTRFSDIRYIMPSVRCLSGYLNTQGYHQTYMSTVKITGNKMGYYGFDNFMNTHKYNKILDRDIIGLHRPEDVKGRDPEGWGLYDQELYTAGLKHIIERDKMEQPFMVSMATMGTHFPAIVDPMCDPDGIGYVSNDMRDALSCGAIMAAKFIEDLKRSVDFSKYKVAIMSDHLAHRNNLTDLLNSLERRNFMILLDESGTAKQVDKPGTMLDVYPTLLDWMGFDLMGDGISLGRTLLRDQPTLVEKYGFDKLNALLNKDAELAQMLWQ